MPLYGIDILNRNIIPAFTHNSRKISKKNRNQQNKREIKRNQRKSCGLLSVYIKACYVIITAFWQENKG
jgi:hypothetical protein